MTRWRKAGLIYALLLLIPGLTWGAVVWDTRGSFWTHQAINNTNLATGPTTTLCTQSGVRTRAWIQIASGPVYFFLDSDRTATPAITDAFKGEMGDVVVVDRVDKFWAVSASPATAPGALMIGCVQ